MGNALSCLEQCRTQQENNQRLLFLQKGARYYYVLLHLVAFVISLGITDWHWDGCAAFNDSLIHARVVRFFVLIRVGAVFKRKKYVLGINSGTEQIHMKLSSDEQTLLWKPHESQKELTRIDLNGVNLIKTQGTLGFSVVSQKGDTLLDLEAENEEVRNNWVMNLQLLCEDSGDVDSGDLTATASPDAASKFRKMVEEKAKKQAYWAKRTQELEDRKREAEEKKKQFAGSGLKYTAIALANRS